MPIGFSTMLSRFSTVLVGLTLSLSTAQLLAPPKGLSFTREISEIPGSFDLVFDGNQCKSQDAHGDNDCHFEWGEDVTGSYKLQVDHTIDEGDQMEGHFKVRGYYQNSLIICNNHAFPTNTLTQPLQIDSLIPYSFTCPLCGEDCVLSFPVVKFTYTIPLPPCPVPAHTVQTNIEYRLQPDSPTEGIPTHVEGIVKIYRSTGEQMAEFSVSAYVK